MCTGISLAGTAGAAVPTSRSAARLLSSGSTFFPPESSVFCCGRIIRSQMLTAALEEAYANRLMKGKFPGCVLHMALTAAASALSLFMNFSRAGVL